MCILTKEDIRKRTREKLNNMSDFERSFKSELLVDDIIASGIVHHYASVMLYMNMKNEVNLERLIRYCISYGKKVYFPKVVGNEIYPVLYNGEFESGAYGILEPKGDIERNIYPKLVITPCLAVDKDNNRLGKGKGYYDRYFERSGECYKIAVAFREQLVDNIPVTGNDIKMDKIYVR